MLCWWCCHPFEGPELHMPYKYFPLKKEFLTCGIFCSFPCMKAFVIDRGGPRAGEYLQLVALMRLHTTKLATPLKPAPKRFCLEAFGGPMSIEEFRQCTDPPLSALPFEIYSKCIIEPREKPVPQVTTQTEDKMKTILKREKPLKRQESTIEKSLGIKRKAAP